jgi:hypothetical protein
MENSLVRVLNSNPLWFHYPRQHMLSSLYMLTNDQLRPAAIHASRVGALQLQHDKNFYVETTLNNFQSIVHLLSSCSNQDILQHFRQVCEHVQPKHRMRLI